MTGKYFALVLGDVTGYEGFWFSVETVQGFTEMFALPALPIDVEIASSDFSVVS